MNVALKELTLLQNKNVLLIKSDPRFVIFDLLEKIILATST